MEFSVFFIIPILIGVAIYIIISVIDKQNTKELLENLGKEHIILHLPKVYRWIGFLDVLVFSAFLFYMISFPNGTGALWVGILFGLAILFGLFLVISSITWRIEIFRSKDYFIYRTCFCRTYKIHYNECKYYKLTENELVLKTDKKKFRIDTHAINFEFLHAMLTQNKVKEKVKVIKDEHIILRLPKIYIWIGCIDILIFSAFLFDVISFPDRTDSLWTGIIFGLFILLGLFLVILSITWRIEIFRHKDYFIYRTCFCKTYIIHYNECIYYKRTDNQIVLKTDKKKFRIDIHAINFEFLSDMLNKYKVKKIVR